MAESMVEKVANAIFDKIWPAQNWEMDEAFCQAVSHVAARAAVEAMREPTENMLNAGDAAIFHSEEDWRANACWSAMIDVALSDHAEINTVECTE